MFLAIRLARGVPNAQQRDSNLTGSLYPSQISNNPEYQTNVKTNKGDVSSAINITSYINVAC